MPGARRALLSANVEIREERVVLTVDGRLVLGGDDVSALRRALG